jgi:hypothetical protein
MGNLLLAHAKAPGVGGTVADRIKDTVSQGLLLRGRLPGEHLGHDDIGTRQRNVLGKM